jgi:hypothetical protein
MAVNGFVSPAPVVQRVRAYFSPVNRQAQMPPVFDAAAQGGFNLDAPPDPWIDLGWIGGFARKSLSKSLAVLTGIPAAVQEQVRTSIEAQVEFDFLSWTKLTMALATGSQHMNLLTPVIGAAGRADGGQARTAASVLNGSTPSTVLLAPADAAHFAAGMWVAVDADYAGETGYVGTPIAGAFLKQALSDVDYIRRVTFNVGLVTQISEGCLTLAQPLPGGVPAPGMKVQPVCGFVDREGGSFFQEWSGLFVLQGSQGERIFFHYPRLQALGSAEETSIPLVAKTKGGLERMVLRGRFMALPVADSLDGERVLCYRSFLPASHALV